MSVFCSLAQVVGELDSVLSHALSFLPCNCSSSNVRVMKQVFLCFDMYKGWLKSSYSEYQTVSWCSLLYMSILTVLVFFIPSSVPSQREDLEECKYISVNIWTNMAVRCRVGCWMCWHDHAVFWHILEPNWFHSCFHCLSVTHAHMKSHSFQPC